MTGELTEHRSKLALLTIGVMVSALAILPVTRDTTEAAAGSDLSGVYDVLVAGGTVAEPDEASGRFHCIADVDVEAATNAVDGAIVCYADEPGASFDGPPAEPADGVPGPAPPPPYTASAPSALSGSYDPGTDTLTLSTCFGNVGGTLGPNVIMQATLASAKATAPDLEGLVLVYGNQRVSSCASGEPEGAAPEAAPLRSYKVGIDPAAGAPWRLGKSLVDNLDFDGDGCRDEDELALPDPAGSCGNDPYNPHDSDADFNSVGSLLVTTVPADWSGQLVPGAYVHCITDTQHTKSGTLQPVTVRLYCYADNAVITVNCEDAQASAVAPGELCSLAASRCQPYGSAPPSACGDGLPGGRPPAPSGDMDAAHSQVAGAYDTEAGTLMVEGCLEAVENFTQGPNVYVRTEVDARTGQGLAWIWLRQALSDCQGGTPQHTKEVDTGPSGPRQVDCGVPPVEQFPQPCPVQMVEQAPRSSSYDSDGDRCPDRVELGTSATVGGLRDPYNRWDWFDQYTGLANPAMDGAVVGGDIGAVVGRFGAVGSPAGDPSEPPAGASGYHTSADRGGSPPGSNLWNLRPPDGAIVGGDVSSVVSQFGHVGCQASE